MRRVLLLAVAAGALWTAPGALAAGWCGSGEASFDRVDATTGRQVHAIWVVPADTPDTFAVGAPQVADDLASMTAWWAGQDPTRVPRVDTAVFPGGTCADISFVRLSLPASAYRGADPAFTQIVGELGSSGFGNANKKYLVYYDGPLVEENVCGSGSGRFDTGPSYAVIWLADCPDVARDAITAHELLHALGALPPGAPHACTAANNPLGPVANPGHPCDSPTDILYPEDQGTPLTQRVLDFGHDDYYAHSGSWIDIQDSQWLHVLAAPSLPVSLTIAGAGSVSSDLPGLVCTATCTTQWDGGSKIVLTPKPGPKSRFVRWSGVCTGRLECPLTVSAAAALTATFGPLRVPVAVGASGEGKVKCSPVCGKTFRAGTRLVLHAVPAKGWRFVRWSGDCAAVHVTTCRPKTDFHVRARAVFRKR